MTNPRTTTRSRLGRAAIALPATCAALFATAVPTGAAEVRAAVPAAAAPKITPKSSVIWSGYVARGQGPYTAAGGQFTVPSVKCTHSRGVLSLWVGLDGIVDLLPQAGAIYDCLFGTWFAFYEIAAQDTHSIPVDGVKYPVAAGDRLSIDVYQMNSGSTRGYVFEIHNETRGWIFSKWEALSAKNQKFVADSADWVVEAAARDHGLLGWIVWPMPNFGTVTLDQCEASTAKVDDGTPGTNPELWKYSLSTHKSTKGLTNHNLADSIPGALKTGTDGLALNAFPLTWKAPK